MLNYQFLETLSRKTLLGIRFWDAALNSPIGNGLRADLHPVANHLKKVTASCTRSGVYAFNHIPGMIDMETASNDDSIGSPLTTRPFVLEVTDLKQQFSSVALNIDLPLPYSGLFLADDNFGSPADTPQGFNLYSSIHRQAPEQFIYVRGDLINRVSGLSAANALVRIQTEDQFSWYGISDKDGKFAVLMPYPFVNISFGSSPPSSDGVSLFQREWTISISVFYDPVEQLLITGSELPDYSSVLSQQQAFIYTESPDSDSGEVMEMQVDLAYGRDLIVKTAGFSELYISSTGSPA